MERRIAVPSILPGSCQEHQRECCFACGCLVCGALLSQADLVLIMSRATDGKIDVTCALCKTSVLVGPKDGGAQ